jgi:CBS domain-containing protein
MSASSGSLIMSQKVDFLARLRVARALVLRDGESFSEASTVLEHIGQVIGAKIGSGLKDYEGAIVGLAKEVAHIEEDSVRRLFNVVREARNKAVHDGAYARHLNGRLVDLLLILEEATMANMDRVDDLMVRNPVFAEPWHLVSHVRKMILTNSFTCIPIYQSHAGKGRWVLIRESALMQWIRSEPNKKKQKDRLALPVSDAIAKHALAVKGAICCSRDASLAEVLSRMNDDPTLVTEKIQGEERLLGIITAFDLL